MSFILDCNRVSSYINTNLMWFLFSQISIIDKKNQFGISIERFRSDNDRDYSNKVLTPYFQYEGIIHESSYANTSRQNRVVERKNSHLLDTTWVFLFQKYVPKSYWEKVVLTTTRLINRLPLKVLGFKIPWKYSHRFILLWEPQTILLLRYLIMCPL